MAQGKASFKNEDMIELDCKVNEVVSQRVDDKHYSVIITLESSSINESGVELLGGFLYSGQATLFLQKSDNMTSLIESLRDGVRVCSLNRITGSTASLSIEENELQNTTFSEDQFCAAVNIIGAPMNILFKVYYSLQQVRDFYKIRLPNSNLGEARLVHDVMKEFCNLTAGAIKIWLSDWEIKLGNSIVTLPYVVPGAFENGHHPGKTYTSTQIFDCFTIKHSSGIEMACSSEIEIKDFKKLAEIRKVTTLVKAVEDDVDITFL